MLENEPIKEKILNALRMNEDKYMAVEELRNIPTLQDYTSQKLTALLNQLVHAKKVERLVDKHWTGFRLRK